MSHQIDLGCLGVTCNLFNMMCFGLWTLHLLCKLPEFACRKLSWIYTAIIYGFGLKLFILQEEPNISWCKILAVSDGYLAIDIWACTALYHSSTDLFPCLKLVSKTNLALTSFACGLQKSSYLDHIVSKLRSSAGKHQETYWSIQKSHSKLWLYFISLTQVALQVHNQEYSQTLASTSRTCGTNHHSLSNPSWDPQYKV